MAITTNSPTPSSEYISNIWYQSWCSLVKLDHLESRSWIMAKSKKRMSQKTKGLKKEKNQSIAKEATNCEASTKSDVSRGSILK